MSNCQLLKTEHYVHCDIYVKTCFILWGDVPYRMRPLGDKILGKAGVCAVLNRRSWEQLLLFLDKALTYGELIK